MKAVVLLVAVLACLVVIDARTLGARHAAPKGWSKQTRALPHHPIKFMVALNQRNLDVLESTFWSVSDPRSPFYQQFLTQEEVLKIVAPPQDEHDKVFLWLANSGAKNIKSYGDAIEAVAPVKTVEKLFSTKMFHFTHADGRKIVRQWGSFSVPREISSFVHMVSGLSEFPVPHLKFHTADGALGVSPQTIQSVYGTPANYKATNSSQGVIEFEDQYFTPADLQTFATQFGVSIPALPASHIIGNNQPGEPGDEAELDIQYIAGVGLGVDNYFWIEADPNWLYGFAVHFFSTKVVPLVISVSYGWSEADQCEQGIGAGECQQLGVDSHGFVSRVNAEFQKIGVRGISILVASGDSGANGRTDGGCTGPTLLPDYPAASPYVTSVGATEIHNPVYNLPSPPPGCVNAGYSCASGGLEAAVSFAQANFASGGGFSNVAGRPSYQDAAVSAYLASGVALPPASYFNATSRGYPDIAAFGSAVLIVDGGSVQAVGGTSCSAPIVGGVVGLLNDYQIKKTGKPLGFLNPLLYQIFESDPSAFTDVTIGDNKCTEDGCSDSCQGFLATKGWDPVTGLGTPKYQAILAYLEKLNTQRGF